MKRKKKKSEFWSSCPDCKYGHPENDCVQAARANGHADGYLNGHRLGIAKGLRMAARIVSHSTRPIHDILERAKEFEEAKGEK